MEAKEFNKFLKIAHCNKHAFSELYNEYYPKIVLHISVKFNMDIAHDIAHDFFCKVIAGDFENAEFINNPASWIYRICDNLAVNIYKKEAKYVSLTDYDFAEDKQDADSVLDIKQLLEKLDDFGKRVIYFHFFEGYTLKEIAGMSDIKYDNFRKKYRALLKSIRKNNNLFPK